MKKYIIPALLLIALCLTLCACTDPNLPAPGEEINVNLNQWMEKIPDNTLLKNIKIPGSHDAGSIGMLSAACTQSDDIKAQLDKGVRYFDIRVNKVDEKYVIFHDIVNGVDFEPIVSDIADFIKNKPTELLILDFQHFKNGSESGVLDIIEKYGLHELAVVNNTDQSDLDYIDSVKLSECRGKILFLWGNRGNLFGKNYLFRRDGDHGDTNYDNVSKSYYYSDMQSVASAEFIADTLPAYYEMYKEFNKGLFVLQCQLTGSFTSNLFNLEKNHAVNMDAYIRNLKSSELLRYTNIILRDFITTGNKIKDIVMLNF